MHARRRAPLRTLRLSSRAAAVRSVRGAQIRKSTAPFCPINHIHEEGEQCCPHGFALALRRSARTAWRSARRDCARARHGSAIGASCSSPYDCLPHRRMCGLACSRPLCTAALPPSWRLPAHRVRARATCVALPWLQLTPVPPCFHWLLLSLAALLGAAALRLAALFTILAQAAAQSKGMLTLTYTYGAPAPSSTHTQLSRCQCAHA